MPHDDDNSRDGVYPANPYADTKPSAPPQPVPHHGGYPAQGYQQQQGGYQQQPYQGQPAYGVPVQAGPYGNQPYPQPAMGQEQEFRVNGQVIRGQLVSRESLPNGGQRMIIRQYLPNGAVKETTVVEKGNDGSAALAGGACGAALCLLCCCGCPN
ncbi:hypothetical protein DIPPA_10098 [Diplonema papillatum]|nr:hypothetical protein DIPPA_10098 [Diplonema papillatum]